MYSELVTQYPIILVVARKLPDWQNTPGLTEILLMLITEPYAFNADSDYMKMIERFVVIMCSKSCGVERVNEARVRLFTS